jgi:hypothetical protein
VFKKLTAMMMVVSFGWGDAALDYVNHFRQEAGLPAFTAQSNLDQSAQAHSHYMQVNNVVGHSEDSSKDGYTGDRPSDRVIAAGYFNRTVSENVAAGQPSVEYAIDSLFSAIYHRFGFLNPTNDEIGIGTDDTFYVYDIGNTRKNDLCENGTYSGGDYVYGACKDTNKKIDLDDWKAAEDDVRKKAGKLILWPPPSGSDVLPAFYEESPDPLPDDSVSGYPVSVAFNEHYFRTAPSVTSFVLTEEASGRELPFITQMDKDNDPNSEFTAYQYALFPREHLEWGTKYAVSLSYDDGNGQQDVNWCFATRSLAPQADRFYRIENNSDVTLNVVSGKRYAIYVVPADTNDALGGWQMRYTCSSHEVSYVDKNTILVTLGGNNDEYAELTFDNGQKVKLVIADSDSAAAPASEVCPKSTTNDSDGDGVADAYDAFPNDPSESVDTDHDGIGNNADTDDDNDGISDADEIAYGLDPLNASDAHADADADGFDNALEISVGTDIRDASSHPRWVLIPIDGGINIPLAVK